MVPAQPSSGTFCESLLEPMDSSASLYGTVLFTWMPAGGLLSFKPHKENWDPGSREVAEEKAGRDNLSLLSVLASYFLGRMGLPCLSTLPET